MSRRSSEDEYETLEEEEKLLLADIYPELKKKLERSIERSRKKRAPVRKVAPVPVVFDVSSDDDDDKVKKEVVDEDEVQILEDVGGERGRGRSEEYSFHSAKSRVEQDKASMSSDSISPPTSFRAEEQSGDEMEGSFVYNPRAPSHSSFEDVEAEEQEPEVESLTGDRVRGDEEDESVHSSDADFIDDDEDPEMSIDQSFQADVAMETPPSKRVLPSRSTRNQQFSTNGRVLVPAAAAKKRTENPAAISPSGAPQRREEEDSGEESFERYLRKIREEDERKKRERERQTEEEEEEMEDSFVVSDESDDVIDDEYENGSGEEEEEEDEWKDSGDSSSEDEKENGRTKKVLEEKPAKKRNLLLDLADTFNSPSVRAVDKESRDPDCHFLLSLSENYEGKRRHADAESFLKRGVKGEKTRTALVQRLFDMYNREIFEEKLPADLEITFNARLRKTAGYCKWSSRASKCTIELSPKVCSQPDRIRDTLAHEMCHAAVFIVNRIMKERHGPVWQHWARAFSSRFRGFPVPSRCHNYEIEAKFVYECDGCGQLIKRHSKSLDTEKKCCGRCHGRFHLRENADTNGKKRGANGFALFVKDNYGEEKRSGRSHKEIMQLLSARFKQSKAVEADRKEDEERDVKRLDLDLSVMSIHEEE